MMMKLILIKSKKIKLKANLEIYQKLFNYFLLN